MSEEKSAVDVISPEIRGAKMKVGGIVEFTKWLGERGIEFFYIYREDEPCETQVL